MTPNANIGAILFIEIDTVLDHLPLFLQNGL